MISAWMIYAVILTAFACVATAAAEHLMWIWRAPRRLPWLFALGVAVSGPLAIPVIHSAHESTPTSYSRSRLMGGEDGTSRVEPRDVKAMTRRASPRAGARSFSPNGLTIGIEPFLIRGWIVSSAIAILVLFVAYARLRRQRARWPETELDGIRVLVAPRQGPAVVGVWRPRIVIPEWSLSLDVNARSFMLRHEREHLATHDPQSLFFAAVALALFPWNLPLWLITHSLRRAIELDCDQRVLRADRDIERYGSLLLEFAAHRARPLSLAAGLIERPSLLEQRIRVMTATRPRRPLVLSLLPVFALALVTLGAARTTVPRSPFASIHARGSSQAKLPLRTSNAAVIEGAPIAVHVSAAQRKITSRQIRSEPTINADWENAPIQYVIDAFANYSHRHIIASPEVDGFITAHIVNEPWMIALTRIMVAHGCSVTFNPDSSITISVERPPKASVPSGRAERPSSSRAITGVVIDAETGRGISGAHINVAGNQAIGEPNEAWTNDRGRFSLRGPDGEVWLDACAAGYDFTRVTLAPADSIATFRGRRAETLVRDTTLYGSIIDSSRAAHALYVVDGRVVDAATPTQIACTPHLVLNIWTPSVFLRVRRANP